MVLTKSPAGIIIATFKINANVQKHELGILKLGVFGDFLEGLILCGATLGVQPHCQGQVLCSKRAYIENRVSHGKDSEATIKNTRLEDLYHRRGFLCRQLHGSRDDRPGATGRSPSLSRKEFGIPRHISCCRGQHGNRAKEQLQSTVCRELDSSLQAQVTWLRTMFEELHGEPIRMNAMFNSAALRKFHNIFHHVVALYMKLILNMFLVEAWLPRLADIWYIPTVYYI